MPELPEVEHAVRRLRALLTGRVIAALRTHHRAQRRTLGASAARRVAGRSVNDVSRRGKHQFIHLDDGATLHVHFRMSGDWQATPLGAPLPPHTRLSLDLDDGTSVALTEPRALATVVLVRDPSRLPTLGPEADDPALDARALAAALTRRRGAIKPVLLDQRVLAGVGNIYAAEALWHARISPRAVAATLSATRLTALLVGVRVALARGMAAGGRAGGATSHAFRVYDREGAACQRCRSAIRRITQAGRSTYYCPRCQAR